LTVVRPGELRQAEWAEFDLDAETPTWTISAKKMKMRRDHTVPLAPQATAILRTLHALTGRRRFVFSVSTDRPLSDATINKALRACGYNTAPGGDHCG